MIDSTNEQKLNQIAEHLRCPQGMKGEEMADMMNETNAPMIQHTLEALEVQTGLHLLEIGPGKAQHLSTLFKKNKNIRYTGLDISKTMIEASEAINAPFIAAGKATFSLYDGLRIPFEKASFNRIYTINTLYFWPTPLDFLAQLRDILKPSGVLTITFAQKSFMQTLPFTRFGFTLYDTAEVQDLATQVGLHTLNIQDYIDPVISKTGEAVKRPYTIIQFNL